MKLVKKLNLEWLEEFLVISRSKSIASAAKFLQKDQVTVGRHMDSIEQWAGVKLIDRKLQPLALTDAGHRFVSTASEVVRLLSEMRDGLLSDDHESYAVLKFSCLHVLSAYFFIDWIYQIESETWPFRHSIEQNNMPECIAALKRGDCDFFLGYSYSEINELDRSGDVDSVHLAKERIIPVSAPDKDGKALFSLAAGRRRQINYLAYSDNSFLGKVVAQISKSSKQKLLLSKRHDGYMAEALKNTAIKGQGVAWLPEYCIKAELESRQLVIAGDDNFFGILDIKLYRLRKKMRNDAERFWNAISQVGQR